MMVGESKVTCPVCGAWVEANREFCEPCHSQLLPCRDCGEEPGLYCRETWSGETLVRRGWPFMQCAGTPPCQTIQRETEKQCFDDWNEAQK